MHDHALGPPIVSLVPARFFYSILNVVQIRNGLHALPNAAHPYLLLATSFYRKLGNLIFHTYSAERFSNCGYFETVIICAERSEVKRSEGA